MPVFVFTDIEGSTELWEQYPKAMGPIISKHFSLLEEGVKTHGGRIIKNTGDGIFGVFPDESGEGPSESLECGLDLQRRFQAETWPDIGELRVRMAFHSGHAEEVGGDYYGTTANRTARFMALGWGGQILVSEELHALARLPAGAEWLDHGVHQVKDLSEPQHIFSLSHPSLSLREFPPLKSQSNQRHNLAEQLSPFVGRRLELGGIASLLAAPNSRCITLLGAGGMGKSRLASEAGLENLYRFRQGAYRASLEGLSTPAQLMERIAASLKIGLYKQKDAREQLIDYLKDKNLLLILDPCDRLAGGAGQISEILEACPGLRVLACSRRRLNLRGETVLEVKGMDYPAQATAQALEASGSAKLFLQQAQALEPGFVWKPEDLVYFLRICRALRGMPLGLELAAALIRLMPLKTMAERLEKDPSFLSGTREDMPASHRSLKALFESSWDMLSEQERDCLAKLSVVQGSFTLPAVQAAFKARPEVLHGLADQSLLDSGEAGRYSMLESIRCFASAKLDEGSPTRREQALDQHARFYCTFIRERERGLMGYEQAKALAETRMEFTNIVRAWDRAAERGWVRELGLAARGLGQFTDMQGLARDWEPRMERAQRLWEGVETKVFEGLPWEESLAAFAGLLANQANYLFSFGRSADALDKMNKSLAHFKKAGKRDGAAYALVRIAVFLGPEEDRRAPALDEAANLYQSMGDANGVAWARRNLGYLLCRQGNSKAGKPMVEESLAVFQKVGNQRETAWCLNSLGQLALEAGQSEAGAQSLREARDMFLGLGDVENAAWTLSTLGQAAAKRQLWAEARPSMEESLKLFGQIRHFRGRSLALRILCEIYAGLGDLDTAFRAVNQIISDAKLANDPSGQAGALLQKGKLLVRQQKFDEALATILESQTLYAKMGSTLGQALALENQACTRLKQGQTPTARGLLQQSCQVFAQAGQRDGEARLNIRMADLDFSESRGDNGEALYQKVLRLSRQNRLGDYSLGALLGMAALLQKQGRNLEALTPALLCERALAVGLMPASDAEFYEDLNRRCAALLAQVSSKLMRSVIDEARAKMAAQDARTLLKESVEKFAS